VLIEDGATDRREIQRQELTSSHRPVHELTHRYIHCHTYISLTMIIIIIFTHRVHHLHARRSNRWQTNVKIESSRVTCQSQDRRTHI